MKTTNSITKITHDGVQVDWLGGGDVVYVLEGVAYTVASGFDSADGQSYIESSRPATTEENRDAARYALNASQRKTPERQNKPKTSTASWIEMNALEDALLARTEQGLF
ncbi:hypothetical protein [Reinekea sp. G2M2-21]|uniref:hypothetical protein n=1 Tax=Reinekea sp. G2M2-21 TaxID=2788942 RepID=UPI0018ABDE36|nr:hypothetical protein [Reinekea sp. G2M2-21]